MAWTTLKTPWTDKFRVPSIDELRHAIAKPNQRLFSSIRSDIGELADVSERLTWQGVPWRWTLAFSCGGESVDVGRALAYVIPDPSRLQICVPVTQEQLEHLPLKRMKKGVRDGVVFARSVAGVWWPTWDVPTEGAFEEVMELLGRKHKLVVAAAAGETVHA